MIALGNNAHFFARQARRPEVVWGFETALRCGPVRTVEHPGAYQWLVAVPDAAGSWVLQLDQLAPSGGTRQRRPHVTTLETLAVAEVDADLLVRLAKKRVVYRAPEQRPGRGRPRLHDEPFRLADEATYGQPQHSTVDIARASRKPALQCASIASRTGVQ